MSGALNCRPGDLAVVVNSRAGNEGKIVRCVRFVGSVPGLFGVDRWETDSQVFTNLGRIVCTLRDAQLKPIRPQADDAECNSAAWLPPVPTKEVA